MANDVSLNSFPANQYEALAMLFMQNQDLSGKAPEEIAALYDDAYQKIKATITTLRKEQDARRAKENPYHSIVG